MALVVKQFNTWPCVTCTLFWVSSKYASSSATPAQYFMLVHSGMACAKVWRISNHHLPLLIHSILRVWIFILGSKFRNWDWNFWFTDLDRNRIFNTEIMVSKFGTETDTRQVLVSVSKVKVLITSYTFCISVPASHKLKGNLIEIKLNYQLLMLLIIVNIMFKYNNRLLGYCCWTNFWC